MFTGHVRANNVVHFYVGKDSSLQTLIDIKYNTNSESEYSGYLEKDGRELHTPFLYIININQFLI